MEGPGSSSGSPRRRAERRLPRQSSPAVSADHPQPSAAGAPLTLSNLNIYRR